MATEKQITAASDLARLAAWLFETDLPKSAAWEKRLIEIANWLTTVDVIEPKSPADEEYESWMEVLNGR